MTDVSKDTQGQVRQSNWRSNTALVFSIISILCSTYLGWVNFFGQKLSDEAVAVLVDRELDDLELFINRFRKTVDDSMRAALNEAGGRGWTHGTIPIQNVEAAGQWAIDSTEAALKGCYRKTGDILIFARVSGTFISEVPFLSHHARRYDSLESEIMKLKVWINQKVEEFVGPMR